MSATRQMAGTVDPAYLYVMTAIAEAGEDLHMVAGRQSRGSPCQ